MASCIWSRSRKWALGLVAIPSVAGADPFDLELIQPLPFGVQSARDVAVDPDGNWWVLDTGGRQLHQLSSDRSRVARVVEVDDDFESIDIARDGHIYLVDSNNDSILILPPDFEDDDERRLTASQLGCTSLDGAAMDHDGTWWVWDAGARMLRRFELRRDRPRNSFPVDALPGPVRDVEVDISGRISLYFSRLPGEPPGFVQYRATGTRIGEWALPSSLDIKRTDGFAFTRDAEIVIVDGIAGHAAVLSGRPPMLTGVVYQDVAPPLRMVSPGDELVLLFDQPIEVGDGFNASDFDLGSGSDRLGAFTVSDNPRNARQAVIRLGNGVRLAPEGVGPGSSRLGLSFDLGEIHDPITGAPALSEGLRDIEIPFRPPMPALVTLLGATLSAQTAPDAYRLDHELTIASGAVVLVTSIELKPPTIPTGLPGAVQIAAPAMAFANSNSQLTLEYEENDLFNEVPGLEANLRIHQVWPRPDGTLERVLVPGTQTVDPETQTVTANLGRTSYLHLPPGSPLIFVTLPLDIVNDRTIVVSPAPATNGGRAEGPEVVLMPGPSGMYTRHEIVISGYEESTTGISVTLRDANLYERAGFPLTSGAVFALEVNGGEISSPVDVVVEFRPLVDTLTLLGLAGDWEDMRIIHRTGYEDPFVFADAPQRVEPQSVLGESIDPGPLEGTHVFGVVAREDLPAVEVAHGLVLR